jgi:MFS family permease
LTDWLINYLTENHIVSDRKEIHMSLNRILIFVHVISAMGLAAGTLMTLLSLLALRRTQQVEQVRAILGLLALSEPVAALSLVLTPLVGIIMTMTAWSWEIAWINVALGSFVLLLPVGAFTGVRRHTLATIVKSLPDGPLPEAVQQRIHDPLTATAVFVMVALLFGIVFLMTTKPALSSSLTAIGVSAALGIVVSLPLWRKKITQQPIETGA